MTGRRLLATVAALALAALPAIAAVDSTAPTGAEGEGTPPPAAFLFALPDEVKTVAMVALAVAIAVYLWRNMRRGD